MSERDRKYDILKEEEGTRREGERPSRAEAAVRGAAQGLTFGFSDEMEAGLRSMVGDERYEEALKEVRDEYEAAREEYPITTTVSDIGSSVVSPGGLARLGAKGLRRLLAGRGARTAAKAPEAVELGRRAQAARAAGTGAAESAVEELGRQEGPIDVGNIVENAIASGALGGTAGAALYRKDITPGSIRKIEDELEVAGRDILNMRRSDKIQLERLGVDTDGLMRKALNKEMLEKGMRSPTEYLRSVEDGLKEAGKKIDDIAVRLNKAEVPVDDVFNDALRSTKKTLEVKNVTPRLRRERNRLEVQLQNVQEEMADLSRSKKKVPPRRMRTLKLREEELRDRLADTKYTRETRKYDDFLDLVQSNYIDELSDTTDLSKLVDVKSSIARDVNKWAGQAGIKDPGQDEVLKGLVGRLSESIDDAIGEKLGPELRDQYKNARREYREYRTLLDGLGTYRGMGDKVDSVAKKYLREESGGSNTKKLGSLLKGGVEVATFGLVGGAREAGRQMQRFGDTPEQFEKAVSTVQGLQKRLERAGRKPVTDRTEIPERFIRRLSQQEEEEGN